MTAVEEMDFGGLRIRFDDNVLRPRPWTVAQAHWARDLLEAAPPGDVLELCAGAGQIGLVAIAGTDRRLVTVDASPIAVGFARANARAAGLIEQVDIRQARLREALRPEETFPVIIADPPWIPREDVEDHPSDPELAIDGGPDGLQVARRCLDVIDQHLSDEGSAVLQLGTTEQVAHVRTWLSEGRRLRITATRDFPRRGVLVHIVR